jgi:cytochrome o ubiquinol oxidase subunit 1
VRAFWFWIVGFYLAFMPLYALGFLGMPRRMEHYNVADWQPYLIVAAAGAALILIGIICLGIQLVVSVKERNEALDLTGDPWNGRTLEWLTASPPAPYNFAVLPQVREVDAFWDMKQRGLAYQRPDHYVDIIMPRNSGAGVIIGGLAFVLGFAVIWYIWWLAIACFLAIAVVVITRASNDDIEYRLPASAVKAIEDRRFEQLARAPKLSDADDPAFAPRPLPEGQA